MVCSSSVDPSLQKPEDLELKIQQAKNVVLDINCKLMLETCVLFEWMNLYWMLATIAGNSSEFFWKNQVLTAMDHAVSLGKKWLQKQSLKYYPTADALAHSQKFLLQYLESKTERFPNKSSTPCSSSSITFSEMKQYLSTCETQSANWLGGRKMYLRWKKLGTISMEVIKQKGNLFFSFLHNGVIAALRCMVEKIQHDLPSKDLVETLRDKTLFQPLALQKATSTAPHVSSQTTTGPRPKRFFVNRNCAFQHPPGTRTNPTKKQHNTFLDPRAACGGSIPRNIPAVPWTAAAPQLHPSFIPHLFLPPPNFYSNPPFCGPPYLFMPPPPHNSKISGTNTNPPFRLSH